MSTLLEQAIVAHGGIDNWTRFRTASATVDIGGVVWRLKGQPELFKSIELTANLQHQHLVATAQGTGWRGTFTPDLVCVESLDGHVAVERRAPGDAYQGHTQQTQWDRLHALYFTGYALWTYLTLPFLYSYPGFRTEELSEWKENGEVWRRLKVTFPDSIASHTREQISYFGEDGLLRRHDYTVDVMGGARGANYASDYRNVGGVMVPMSRRVFSYDESGQNVDVPLLVSIDFRNILFQT